MDYCEWVEAQRGRTPPITTWEGIAAEQVSDPNVSTHKSTVRKTWVGQNVVLTRVIVQGKSIGKAHSHESEQVSMILRGGVRVFMENGNYVATAGSIVHIPAKSVHMFESLDEETEILDVYDLRDSAKELGKQYHPNVSFDVNNETSTSSS